MKFDEVAVPGGRLRIARFGDGPRLIIAAHGISASLMAWRAVGDALPTDWSLVAADLRGRGHSAGLPGPYGLDRHAEDLELVARHVGADGTSVLTGHSMGAYVAALHAAARIGAARTGAAGDGGWRYARVVLVDGGLPLPLPPGADPDEVMAATLGPAIARLSRTFPDVEAYLDLFRAHPALAGDWSPVVEEYVRYDATGPDGAVRSRVREEAVRQDGRWPLTRHAELGAALKAIEPAPLLLRAPRGLLNQDVGLQPDDLTARWKAELPGLRDEVVPDCNHYTILFDPRCAALVAARLTAG
ncbi:alpha/beta hydrolase [Microbispora triticiradicis]|uniref:Alpha/beta hydrolase n=2 Tax=Microbispora TaxID=2005 RepID=A0ABY3LXB7_9ACTN|nr:MULTISPECIES: alpha/beta hydrolase [Microbispora]TLP58561.1 alpha/beta hydrolase [Microbispora fusca]TYB57687.1 alpha/beta hydrolase [Microbispora tritici]